MIALLAVAPAAACSCFIAGTPIETDRGPVPIENLKVGDMVLAFRADHTTVLRRVTHLHEATVHRTLELKVGDRTLHTTDEHPFWTPEVRSFTRAADLVAGATLAMLGDEQKMFPARLAATRSVARPAGIKVYNITVEGPEHTYFADHVAVHNKSPDYEPYARDAGGPTGSYIVNGTDRPLRVELQQLPNLTLDDASLKLEQMPLSKLARIEGKSVDLAPGAHLDVYGTLVAPDGELPNIGIVNIGAGPQLLRVLGAATIVESGGQLSFKLAKGSVVPMGPETPACAPAIGGSGVSWTTVSGGRYTIEASTVAGSCTEVKLARGAVDGGSPDGGATDGGLDDAGDPDAGALDAGDPDAGELDAGDPDGSAGPADAGAPKDAGSSSQTAFRWCGPEGSWPFAVGDELQILPGGMGRLSVASASYEFEAVSSAASALPTTSNVLTVAEDTSCVQVSECRSLQRRLSFGVIGASGTVSLPIGKETPVQVNTSGGGTAAERHWLMRAYGAPLRTEACKDPRYVVDYVRVRKL